MVTNYQNFKNNSSLGKLKCLPVYLFIGSAGSSSWDTDTTTHPMELEDPTLLPWPCDPGEELGARTHKLNCDVPVVTHHERCSNSP